MFFFLYYHCNLGVCFAFLILGYGYIIYVSYTLASRNFQTFVIFGANGAFGGLHAGGWQ